MKLTKTALNKFMTFHSSSRYNEWSKPQAVRVAYDLLNKGEGEQVIQNGCYSERHDSGRGGDFLINGKEGYVAKGLANWTADGYEFSETERLQFEK